MQVFLGPVWGSFLELLLLQEVPKATSSPKRGQILQTAEAPKALLYTTSGKAPSEQLPELLASLLPSARPPPSRSPPQIRRHPPPSLRAAPPAALLLATFLSARPTHRRISSLPASPPRGLAGGSARRQLPPRAATCRQWISSPPRAPRRRLCSASPCLHAAPAAGPAPRRPSLRAVEAGNSAPRRPDEQEANGQKLPQTDLLDSLKNSLLD